MTPTELRKRGFKALVDARDRCVDAVRFIQQYAPSDRDYTKERHQCWVN